jgi:hypothetical protein
MPHPDFDIREYDETIGLAHWPFGECRRCEPNSSVVVALRKFVISLLVLALLLTEACNKKKPVPPPRSLAPTLSVALPDEIPENPEAPAPVVAQAPVTPPPVKTKPNKKLARSAAKKTAAPASPAPAPASPPAPATDSQTVASLHPHGSAASEIVPDTAIAAAMPSEAIIKQKESTAQIVDSTENSLKNLSRHLSEEEKSLKTQIQSYLQQSRKATADGDYERAYNLAKKAQLLAEALLKK